MAEGMHGSAVPQIAGQNHLESFEATVGLTNREQVKHGLCGVVAGAVAAVENGDSCSVLCVLCGSLSGVAHGDDVGVAVHHLNGVEQGLAFDHGRGFHVPEVDHIAAQSLHGRLKRHAGSGAGLKKQVAENLSLQEGKVVFAFGHGQQAFGIVEDAQDVFVGQVVHGNESRHGVPSVENTTR